MVKQGAFALMMVGSVAVAATSTTATLVGVFDPTHIRAKGSAEMQPRPDCKACHARAEITTDASRASVLNIQVDHGREKPGEWALTGTTCNGGTAFAARKLALFYAKGVLTGSFTGVLAADIILTQESRTMSCTVPRLNTLVPENATLRKLATDMHFVEGPVWFDDATGGFLVFSDIPGNVLKRWRAQDGVTTFRAPSHNANGNTRDRAGRLITCEHGSRRVTRTEPDGSVRVVAERFEGQRLNSPNDAVIKSDGSLWFTDPPYGLADKSLKELDHNYVFRRAPDGATLTVVARDFDMPNGLCFSPDETKLYIADSGTPHHIRVFDVNPAGTLANGRVFCVIAPGVPDGIRCDRAGNIWSTAGDGVQVFAPGGALIGKIPVPETPANLCFGGRAGTTLFITARTSLYALDLTATGKHK